MSICQLQKVIRAIFITSFLFACSTSKIAKPIDRQISANWLKIPLKYAIRDQDDSYLIHPFFDVDPGFKVERRTINYFITTPEDSFYKYNFDLYSGKLYKDRNYCTVNDVWETYSNKIYRPNFTQGIVPRTYDQNKNPQKIIVFSNKNEIEKFSYSPTNFETAKILGSVLLESCDNYPCDLKSKWKSTQILVSVNSHDKNYSDINTLSELKKKVDWPYVKSILVNQDGVHQISDKFYPAYRIPTELNLSESLKYFTANSTVTKMDVLFKWREQCFAMYDDLWDKTEKIRSEKSGQQASFLKIFKEFYSLNSTLFYSCQKLVRPANVNENDRRLWFFTYIQAFTNLEKNGLFFNCTDNSWSYNPKTDDDHYLVDQNKELERCQGKNIEKSFDQAINGLSFLKNQLNKSFRFIEYDTQHGGSHQKLYAWVPGAGKVSNCINPKENIKEIPVDIFPQDVVWQNFTPDIEDDGLIK